MEKVNNLKFINISMSNSWYPQDKKELDSMVSEFLKEAKTTKLEIHGLIVPHAGYTYSGKIAGRAFGLVDSRKMKKVIVLGPSHYTGFHGIASLRKIATPLGEVRIQKNDFSKLEYEHSVENQIPFLQKITPKIKILPLVVGEISDIEAEKIAKNLIEKNVKDTLFVFSTDLSHFFPYGHALETDEKTIGIIKNLEFSKFDEIDACGKFPLRIMMHICRLNGWRPHLIEYKDSGDIIGDKSSVVGYSSFWF
jgi:MEMO1 family protein